jgi:hypothetical protein
MRWNRWTIGVIATLFVLYFLFVTVPASPIAILVLPVLFGLAYWGLRQNRISETEGSLLEKLNGQAPLRNYLGLLGLPVTSTLVYAFAMSLNLRVHTNWILYLITTALGFILFAISLFKLQRKARSSLAEAG